MSIKELLLGSSHAKAETAKYIYPNSLQAWLPIADIREGIIITQDGGYVKLLEILPVNFHLQSATEQARIVSCFSSWLKVAPDTLQILCVAQTTDVESYAKRMHGYAQREADARCKSMIEDNIGEVRYMSEIGALSTRFFLAFRFEPQMAADFETIADALYDVECTARSYLARCGLEVVQPDYSDNFVVGTVYSLLCKRSSRRARLPLYFRTMLSQIHGCHELTLAMLEDGGAEPEPLTEETTEGKTETRRKRKKQKKSAMRKKEEDPEGGRTTVMDLICPVSADLTHRSYIEVDGVYHAYLYIAGYGYQSLVAAGWLASVVGIGDGVSVSFTLARRQRDKILPKVAQSTMWSRSRMRDVGDTRSDYEQLDSAIASGLYIKDSMNRYSEDYYDMYTLIEVVADDPDALEQRLSETETRCASQDIICKRCDYGQEQAFRSFLPIVSLDPDIERKARRNVLTSGAAASFPFSSFEICEQDGILLGSNMHTGSLCMLDIFNSARYSNANMTVLGMSGAGKTYLLQLIAMRYRQQGVQTFIIAPYKGYEYRPACEAIGGQYIKLSPSSTDCINIMEIRRTSLDIDAGSERTETRNDSLLADKVGKLHILFSLLRPGINEIERNLLDLAIAECYARFGITYENESVFDENGVIRPMPCLRNLYQVLHEKEETRTLAAVLGRFASGSAASLGGQTNVDLDNPYVVLDISEIGKDLLPVGMLIATDYASDICKRSRTEQKVMILDELWVLIGASSNALAGDFVLDIFKTLRGFGAAAIAATQDLEDFFALEGGKYGKAVLHNSRTKIALMTEPEEAVLIQKTLHLTDEELNLYTGFERGQALLCAGRNRIGVNIHASRAEHDLITTDRRDLERIRHRAALQKLSDTQDAITRTPERTDVNVQLDA